METSELGVALERIERKLDSLHRKIDQLQTPEKLPERPAAKRILAHCLTIKVSCPPGPRRD